MNPHDNFDELSRRKLAEREFAFDEAHWHDVQRRLEEQGRRKGAWWLWPVAALLLIGGGSALYFASDEEAPEKRDAQAGNVAAPLQNALVPQASTALTERAESTIPEMDARTEDLAHSTTSKGSGITNDRTLRVPSRDPADPQVADQVVNAPEATVPHVAQAVVAPSVELSVDMNVTSDSAAVPVEMISVNGSAPVTQEEERPGSEGSIPALADAVPVEPSAVAPEIAPEILPEAVSAEEVLQAAPQAALSDTAAQPIEQVPEYVQPAARRSPLEVSILGGPQWTSNHYAGGNSGEWINGISGLPAGAGGAEAMFMGRNFGIGLGAHVVTYKERFVESELFRTELEYKNTYFLQTIDTALTFVVGVDTTGGTPSYITQSIDTSITILGVIVDTTVNNVRVREARDVVNVASYVEVPLLFDAHLTQGRLKFGARGGPSFGVLTGTRGELPGTSDGPAAQFRSTVWGWTARVYVRYALGPAWSIGIEPSMRGQFSNAFSGSDPLRRNNATQLLFGATYRFR